MDNLTIDEKRKYYDKMYRKYKDIQKMPEDVLAKVFKYGNDIRNAEGKNKVYKVPQSILRERSDYSKKLKKKYGEYDRMPEDVQDQITTIGKLLNENEKKMESYIGDLYDKGKLTIEQLDNISDKLRNREIFTIEEVKNEINKKETKEEPKPESKKETSSNEDLEKYIMETKKTDAHKRLIKKIPDNKYNKRTILKIIYKILQNKIKNVNEFPKNTDDNAEDLEDVISISKPKTIIKKEEPVKIEEKITNSNKMLTIKKRGRPRKVKDIANEPVKKKVGRPPKEGQDKIYYGIDELPKYHRRPTAEEALKNKKVSYWGIMKIDKKLLEENKNPKKTENKIKELQIEIAKNAGRYGFLSKNVNYKKSKDIDHEEEEKELNELKIKLKDLNDKLKNLQ
jgi:hypothetical protein